MNFVVLDIASIIWDKKQFERDASVYYQLADEISVFIDAFETVGLNLLIRQNLLDEILQSFPFDLTSDKAYFKEFRTIAYSFLSKISDIVEYEEIQNSTIATIPSILQNHYSSTTKLECTYLIQEMHTNEQNVIFCTFSAIWNNGKLQSQNGNLTKCYDTLIHPNNNLETYLKSISKQFDHNSKHDSCKGIHYIGNEKVNPLSCYNERIGDKTIPQQLLDIAMPFRNNFYSWDKNNQTYVCFKNHQDNKYHGYDEDIKNVPPQIKNTFHK